MATKKPSGSNTGRATKSQSNTSSTKRKSACNCGSNCASNCNSNCNADDCGSHSTKGEAAGLNQLEFYKQLFKQMAMGSSSIDAIKEKVSDASLAKNLNKQQKTYETKQNELLVKINALHGEPKFPPLMSKLMVKSGVMFNTMVDDSASKIAEIMIQGINMGVIAVTRLNNQAQSVGLDLEDGKKIMTVYEQQLDVLKNYL